MNGKRALNAIAVIAILVTVVTALAGCTNHSEEGTIGAGNIDQAILESESGFEVTEEHAMKLYEYQRAQDLRTLILASLEIQDALVVLDIGLISPEDDQSSNREPSASVLLTVTDSYTLANQDIQDIAEIIKNGVPGIKYENITITDSDLNVYQIDDGNEVIDID
jgi:flagellar biosynthesis/type III secretory pathway M-ring protein FliF/YscJ